MYQVFKERRKLENRNEIVSLKRAYGSYIILWLKYLCCDECKYSLLNKLKMLPQENRLTSALFNCFAFKQFLIFQNN